MSKYKVLKDNIKNVVAQEFEKTIPIITEEYEAKIRRQAAEITRLLAENERLKPNYENIRAKGQNEAWELARKLSRMEIEDKIQEAFNLEYSFALTVIEQITYPEAAAKVAEWEKAKEEIKVGDVVSREGLYGVVKSVSDDWLKGITASGISFQWLKRKCTKTGRHIDIDSFLKQIGGAE